MASLRKLKALFLRKLKPVEKLKILNFKAIKNVMRLAWNVVKYHKFL